MGPHLLCLLLHGMLSPVPSYVGLECILIGHPRSSRLRRHLIPHLWVFFPCDLVWVSLRRNDHYSECGANFHGNGLSGMLHRDPDAQIWPAKVLGVPSDNVRHFGPFDSGNFHYARLDTRRDGNPVQLCQLCNRRGHLHWWSDHFCGQSAWKVETGRVWLLRS